MSLRTRRGDSDSEQIGFPHRHPNLATFDAGPAILLRNNTPATLADVQVNDRIGVASPRQASQYTALTMIVHGPA